MAGFIAVGIGLGAEKLGRKISEKRIERKEKKATEVRRLLSFAMYAANINVGARSHLWVCRVLMYGSGAEQDFKTVEKAREEERGSATRADAGGTTSECEFGENPTAGRSATTI